MHREARYGERSERNDLPEAGLQGDFFYRHFEWIRYKCEKAVAITEWQQKIRKNKQGE